MIEEVWIIVDGELSVDDCFFYVLDLLLGMFGVVDVLLFI